MKKLLLLLPLLTLLSSCNNGATHDTIPNDDPSLSMTTLNGDWYLQEIDGKNVGLDVPASERKLADIAFVLEENKMTGNDSCNAIFSDIEKYNDNELIFFQIGQTKRLCADMSLANKLNKHLTEVRYYSVEDQELTLLEANQKIKSKWLRKL